MPPEDAEQSVARLPGVPERLEPEPHYVRRAFSLFPSGVVCIGAEIDGVPEALIASSFSVGVSLDPPLTMFAVQRSSQTWPVIAAAPSIGVSVLGKDHAVICRQIASKPRAERFDGISIHRARDGAIYIPDSAAWIESSVYSTFDAGDHVVVILKAEAIGFDDELDPLVFHRSKFPLLTTADVPAAR